MILGDYSLKQVKRKIVISNTLTYSNSKDLIEDSILLYYDVGKGLQTRDLDKETLEFAKKVKENSYDLFKDYFSLDKFKEYIKCEKDKTGYEITDEQTRVNLIKTLFAFGMENRDIPVFVQIGNSRNYYLINDLALIQNKKIMSYEDILEKTLELDNLFAEQIYNLKREIGYRNKINKLVKLANGCA